MRYQPGALLFCAGQLGRRPLLQCRKLPHLALCRIPFGRHFPQLLVAVARERLFLRAQPGALLFRAGQLGRRRLLQFGKLPYLVLCLIPVGCQLLQLLAVPRERLFFCAQPGALFPCSGQFVCSRVMPRRQFLQLFFGVIALGRQRLQLFFATRRQFFLFRLQSGASLQCSGQFGCRDPVQFRQLPQLLNRRVPFTPQRLPFRRQRLPFRRQRLHLFPATSQLVSLRRQPGALLPHAGQFRQGDLVQLGELLQLVPLCLFLCRHMFKPLF